MIEENHPDAVFEVEYYLIDGHDVGRVMYDPQIEEYVEGEMMDEYGEWHECPPHDILMDGEEISSLRARELARVLGGTL